MRKEVKRSLLVWPAIASLTISGLSFFQTADKRTWDSVTNNASFAWRAMGGSKLMEPYFVENSNVVTASSVPAIPPLPELPELPVVGPPTQTFPAIIPPSQTNVELVERVPHGAPAMQLPERLALETNSAPPTGTAWLQSARQSATSLLQSIRSTENRIAEITKDYFVKVDLAAPEMTSPQSDGLATDPAVIMLLETPAENEITIYEVAPVEDVEPVADAPEARIAALNGPQLTAPIEQPESDPDLTALLAEFAPPALSETPELPGSGEFDSDSEAIEIEEVTALPAESLSIELMEPTDLAPTYESAEAAELVESKDLDHELAEQPELNETIPLIEATELEFEAATTSESILPKSIANLGDLAARSDQEPEPIPAVSGAEITQPESPREVADVNPASWPLTPKLDEQLDRLAALSIRLLPSETNHLVSLPVSHDPLTEWSQSVSDRLAQLRSLDRLGNPRAADLLSELEQLVDQGLADAELVSDRETQIAWLQTAHALQRRVNVWQPVFRVISDEFQIDPTIHHAPVIPSVEQLRQELDATGDAAGWNAYLLLDEITAAAGSDDLEQRRDVATRFLNRIHKDDLHSAHQAWLQGESIDQLQRAIQPWTAQAIDYAAFLSKIEQQESEPVGLSFNEVTEVVRTLRHAENPNAANIAEVIDRDYRNANMRISISEAMMQRLLPKIDPHTMPMRTQIFSTKVNGVTRVDSELKVDLQPANDRWSFTLETHGTMKTQSTGRQGTTSVSTSRQSQFMAATPIEISRDGVDIKDSNVDVAGATRLRGIHTNYDSWPVFGPMIRNIAESQYHERAGAMNRIANRRIKTQLGNEITSRLSDRVELRSSQVRESVLSPLDRLQLDPRVFELQTTEERLTARYRLAGDWQLAAFTPRPRAPQSSLMSVQVHQSALNNTMEQLVPRDQSKTIDELIVQGLSIFGVTDPELPSDLPEGVVVQFAKTRPITVELEDGVMWMTLRIVKLTRDRMKLSRFIVRAAYRPEIDGINAHLVRDGHLRISGPGMSMRERLPVRAIFNKVLANSRKFPITVPGLTSRTNTDELMISQLELRDGWIAMAISEVEAPRVALKVNAEER